MRRVLFTMIVLNLLAVPLYPCAMGDDEPVLEPTESTEAGRTGVAAESAPNIEPPAPIAVIRLYRDPQADGKAYTTPEVPLDGVDIPFDAIAAYAGTESGANLKDAIIAAVPSDQRDQAVTAMMDERIFAAPYRSGERLSLQPGSIQRMQVGPCVFIDALKQPLPNAQVEIWVGDAPQHHNARRKIWIANARLDANGKMKSARSSVQTRLRHILFVVRHPDCGCVPAISRYSSSETVHTLRVPALPKDKWCVFVDALGHPMAGATVEVGPFERWGYRQKREWLQPPITLDEAGRLRPPHFNPTLERCCFLVHDPNYGIGIVQPWSGGYVRDKLLSLCVVPLVAIGTRADERSIWGTVVDADGNPIPGALIQSRSVCTPGGGRLDVWWPWRATWDMQAKVLTDAQGRFAMHLPLGKDNGTLGRPVPPDASYQVMIDPPAPLDLESFHGLLAGGQEHTITLQRKPAGLQVFSGTLVFEDEFGPVTDPEKLKQVALSIWTPRPDARSGAMTYGGGGWMGKKELPFGIYSARADWDGKLYVFEPIEVTAESPEIVVFVPNQIKAAERLYYGRVVHGVTGEPIADALVMRHPLASLFNAITGEEARRQIFDVGPELDSDDDLVELLKSYPQLGMTRTDAAGRFETALSIPPSDPPSNCLLAIKKDFLGAQQLLRLPLPGMDETGRRRYRELETDPTGKVLVPDMKLFPAATVIVEPNVPEWNELRPEKEVRILYLTARGDPTPWLKDLWATPASNRGGCVFRKYDVPTNQLQMVYIPANVTVTLTIRRRDQRFAPFVVEGIHLRQGQVLDLGQIEFPEAMQVVARVIDSTGKPLEGITVKSLADGRNYLFRGAVTDGQGVARVDVPPHSQGQLFVEYYDLEAREKIRQGTPYRVAGHEDAGREFVLMLSDEFLAQLLEARKDL